MPNADSPHKRNATMHALIGGILGNLRVLTAAQV